MKKRFKILIFSGAGISKESGIETFRDSKDSLWNNHKIEDVASIDGWNNNKQLVLDFYNNRRRELYNVEPNIAHISIAQLESDFDVTISTQNVDDLQERAGSTNILHLHGELRKARRFFTDEIIDKLDDISIDDNMRPHIVWFGEGLDKSILDKSKEAADEADICIIIGTSMKVYPAAILPFMTKHTCLIYYIDPSDIDFNIPKHRQSYFYHFKENATTGIIKVIDDIKETFLTTK